MVFDLFIYTFRSPDLFRNFCFSSHLTPANTRTSLGVLSLLSWMDNSNMKRSRLFWFGVTTQKSYSIFILKNFDNLPQSIIQNKSLTPINPINHRFHKSNHIHRCKHLFEFSLTTITQLGIII